MGSSMQTDESIRSPLSGEDDVELSSTNTHRRHRSAGSLDIETQGNLMTPVTKIEQDSNTANSSTPLEPTLPAPRVIDGLFDKTFKPENLTGKKKEKRILEIIEQQFNLEILLKHNQMVEIEEEIGKCEAQMIALRNKFSVDPSVKLPNEPTEFTEKYLRILEKTDGLYKKHKSVTWNNGYNENQSLFQSNGGMPHDPSNAETLYSRTRSHTSSLRPSSGRYSSSDCIYRRTDGVYVKLTCPNCGRCNFSSAQGFLNHCRLAHQKEFTSQDNAAIICGEVLHEEDQDLEGVKVIQSLKDKGLDPNKNLSRPEVPFLSLMLQNSGSNTSTAGTTTLAASASTGIGGAPVDNAALSQADSQKRKNRPFPEGGLGSKTPRTTTKLKLKMKKLGKDSEFEDLVKDVTSEVENPHLFEEEEEEQQDSSNPEVAVQVSHSRNSSVSGRGSSSSRGARRGARGRRKSRGGFSLMNDVESESSTKDKSNDEDITMQD